MLIWRKVEPNSGGLFAYKVYGSFPDVTAEDFLQVQIDVDYRKQWDPTAQELQIIETDPKSESSVSHSTDVIHWEMIWPVGVIIMLFLDEFFHLIIYFNLYLCRNYFLTEITYINDDGSWIERRDL